MLDGLLMNMGGPRGHRKADTRGAAGAPAHPGRTGGSGRRDQGVHLAAGAEQELGVARNARGGARSARRAVEHLFLDRRAASRSCSASRSGRRWTIRGATSSSCWFPARRRWRWSRCRLVLGPGQRFGPHASHNGEEFGYVIRGRLSVTLGRRSTIAKAGESFSYKAQQEHSIRNVGPVAGGGAVRDLAAAVLARRTVGRHGSESGRRRGVHRR